MRLSLLSRRTTATQALSSSAGKSSVMSTDHKQQAKRLRTSLAERGVEVTHSEALELVAHQYGARDWNTLAAAARGGLTPTRRRVRPRHPGAPDLRRGQGA